MLDDNIDTYIGINNTKRIYVSVVFNDIGWHANVEISK